MSEPELDSSKDNSNGWGGKRPGAGRPKGSMNESTKLRSEVKQAYQDRVARNADRIFNSQFNLATGEQYLMHKYTVGSGAKARTVVETVEDPELIKAFINDELNQSGDDEWYYISTKPANGYALDSMLDRAFGKSDSKVDLTNNGKDFPTPILGGATGVHSDDSDS